MAFKSIFLFLILPIRKTDIITLFRLNQPWTIRMIKMHLLSLTEVIIAFFFDIRHAVHIHVQEKRKGKSKRLRFI